MCVLPVRGVFLSFASFPLRDGGGAKGFALANDIDGHPPQLNDRGHVLFQAGLFGGGHCHPTEHREPFGEARQVLPL